MALQRIKDYWNRHDSLGVLLHDDEAVEALLEHVTPELLHRCIADVRSWRDSHMSSPQHEYDEEFQEWERLLLQLQKESLTSKKPRKTASGPRKKATAGQEVHEKASPLERRFQRADARVYSWFKQSLTLKGYDVPPRKVDWLHTLAANLSSGVVGAALAHTALIILIGEDQASNKSFTWDHVIQHDQAWGMILRQKVGARNWNVWKMLVERHQKRKRAPARDPWMKKASSSPRTKKASSTPRTKKATVTEADQEVYDLFLLGLRHLEAPEAELLPGDADPNWLDRLATQGYLQPEVVSHVLAFTALALEIGVARAEAEPYLFEWATVQAQSAESQRWGSIMEQKVHARAYSEIMALLAGRYRKQQRAPPPVEASFQALLEFVDARPRKLPEIHSYLQQHKAAIATRDSLQRHADILHWMIGRPSLWAKVSAPQRQQGALLIQQWLDTLGVPLIPSARQQNDEELRTWLQTHFGMDGQGPTQAQDAMRCMVHAEFAPSGRAVNVPGSATAPPAVQPRCPKCLDAQGEPTLRRTDRNGKWQPLDGSCNTRGRCYVTCPDGQQRNLRTGRCVKVR